MTASSVSLATPRAPRFLPAYEAPSGLPADSSKLLITIDQAQPAQSLHSLASEGPVQIVQVDELPSAAPLRDRMVQKGKKLNEFRRILKNNLVFIQQASYATQTPATTFANDVVKLKQEFQIFCNALTEREKAYLEKSRAKTQAALDKLVQGTGSYVFLREAYLDRLIANSKGISEKDIVAAKAKLQKFEGRFQAIAEELDKAASVAQGPARIDTKTLRTVEQEFQQYAAGLPLKLKTEVHKELEQAWASVRMANKSQTAYTRAASKSQGNTSLVPSKRERNAVALQATRPALANLASRVSEAQPMLPPLFAPVQEQPEPVKIVDVGQLPSMARLVAPKPKSDKINVEALKEKFPNSVCVLAFYLNQLHTGMIAYFKQNPNAEMGKRPIAVIPLKDAMQRCMEFYSQAIGDLQAQFPEEMNAKITEMLAWREVYFPNVLLPFEAIVSRLLEFRGIMEGMEKEIAAAQVKPECSSKTFRAAFSQACKRYRVFAEIADKVKEILKDPAKKAMLAKEQAINGETHGRVYDQLSKYIAIRLALSKPKKQQAKKAGDVARADDQKKDAL